MVSVLLAVLLVAAVGAYVQAQRADAASDPGWIEDAGAVPRSVGTPLLSVRRSPGWLSGPITEARLGEQLTAAVGTPGPSDVACLNVRRNGETVTSVQGDSPLPPSSLMKIVTAATILQKAGPEATYTTEVFARSDDLASLSIDGVLPGAIYLVGRGDPVLSTPTYYQRFAEPTAHTDFTELARQVASALRRRGIVAIAGGIVADESRFPEEERDYAGQLPGPDGSPVWEPSYISLNASGPLSALMLNDGYLSFSPSADPANQRQNVRAADPAQHAADVLSAMLQSQGVLVPATAGKGVAPALAERVSLGAVESPPMAEIVTRMLRYSDNTTAEMLLKEIGRRSNGSARAQAVLGVYDLLQRLMGIPIEGMVIADGSGLSTQNLLTCDLIVELLGRAGPLSPLVRGMSVLGESGTLSGCQSSGGAWSGRVWAHAGALGGVSAIAGVTIAANDDVLTFAMISRSEETPGGLCTNLQRTLIAALLGHPHGPSAADDLLHPVPGAAAPSGSGGGA